MTLAIDGAPPRVGGTPLVWPPAATPAQRELLFEVLDSGRWGATTGPLCERFAARFAAMHGCPTAVCTVNGTVGLTAALVAVGVRPGDEVVVPSYTFVASATSVLLMGARPVIADVDPRLGCLTGETLQPALSARTRAIMVVHIAGAPCPMDEINAIAASWGIPVVEDAAQAHGATYKGRPVGSLGNIASFSFQASKAMTAGEGGILTTRDAELGELAWSLCNVGRVRDGAWYGHHRVGWNLRMSEFQAAVLLPWLDLITEQIQFREAFTQELAGYLARDGLGVVVPSPDGTTRHTRHLGMIDIDPHDAGVDKAWVIKALHAEGLNTDAGYPGMADIPAIAAESRLMPTPGTARFSASVIWLRQHELMRVDGTQEVADALNAVLADPRAKATT
ncbi:DegT/DnrJ/EryC1/StrS family aminotransferase [Propioniciclava sinopodophylli]|uniref:DegT/DnrJ/EryC1/StrS family aminotransferase n=1 Tax=Propioniciclava sinopodophylli TaxID=1837344 RepID=A0A4Q9KBH3_9ACTN|nr:DegT/DnrJ/EryC1/StrS family aminotransferase [Propioniciclava sinopodophylli]TBT83028.1 DegT/DnrJ/EryC1/StrS family aminotransferase [Propioniciclava sinopodophylli]